MKQVSSEYQIVSALERSVWSSSSPVYSKKKLKQTEDDCYPAFFSFLFFFFSQETQTETRTERNPQIITASIIITALEKGRFHSQS